MIIALTELVMEKTDRISTLSSCNTISGRRKRSSDKEFILEDRCKSKKRTKKRAVKKERSLIDSYV